MVAFILYGLEYLFVFVFIEINIFSLDYGFHASYKYTFKYLTAFGSFLGFFFVIKTIHYNMNGVRMSNSLEKLSFVLSWKIVINSSLKHFISDNIFSEWL